jgi:hypothetical protein
MTVACCALWVFMEPNGDGKKKKQILLDRKNIFLGGKLKKKAAYPNGCYKKQ